MGDRSTRGHHSKRSSLDLPRATSIALMLVAAACARGPVERDAAPIPTAGLLDDFDPSLEIRYDERHNELILESAPVDLPARAGHHDAPRPPAQYGTIPVDGWLHGFDVELVDVNDRTVPRTALHHVNVITPDRRELFSDIMQRVGAAGHETAPIGLPSLIGYPVRAGERLIMTVMLHNPTDTAYEGVRVRVRMPHSGPKRVVPPLEFFPFYLDVMPPASVHQYDVPPGGLHEKTWQGSPAVDGRILALGGHLHDNGVVLRIEDLTTRAVLWETHPIVDMDGRVVGMPQDHFFTKLGISIRRDHVYRLTAIYRNNSDTTIVGAMGAIGGIISIPKDQVWPAVDTASSEFALDLELVRTGGAVDGVRSTTNATEGGAAHNHGGIH